MPKTSKPTRSACSICSTRSLRRCDGLTARLASSYAAAKLSMPTSIPVLPDTSITLQLCFSDCVLAIVFYRPVWLRLFYHELATPAFDGLSELAECASAAGQLVGDAHRRAGVDVTPQQ